MPLYSPTFTARGAGAASQSRASSGLTAKSRKSEAIVGRWTSVVVLFVLALAAAPPGAGAAELPLVADALTHERAGRTEACGIRITGGSAGPKAASVWVDLSVNVWASGAALVQAIAYEMPPSTYDKETRPVRVPIQRAWVKPRDAPGSTRLGENLEARDGLVYRITLDDATRLFEAIATGKPLAIGMRPWGVRREWVFEGAAQLSGAARDSLRACLGALVN